MSPFCTLFARLLMLGAVVLGLAALPATAQASTPTGGTITGHVLASDGTPMSDAYVQALRADAEGNWMWDGPATTSASDGSYSIPVTSDGAYVVAVTPQSGSFDIIYSNGRNTLPTSTSDAGVLDVANASTVDFGALHLKDAPNSDLYGMVHNAARGDLDGVLVEAYRSGDAPTAAPVGSAITYGGEYDLWLPAGTYRLHFTHLAGDYGDKILDPSQDPSLDLTVASDSYQEVPAVTLEAASSFVTGTGYVFTGSAGLGLGGATVTAYRVSGTRYTDSYRVDPVDMATTTANGGYSFDRIIAGKHYTIGVTKPGYADVWSGGSLDSDHASLTYSYADFGFDDISMSPAPSISGRVTDSTGQPVVGATVSPLKWSDDLYGNAQFYQPVDGVTTDAQGNYSVTLSANGVSRPGRYTLQVDPDGTSSRGGLTYYGNQTEQPPTPTDDATSFDVGQGQQVAGKDVQLQDTTEAVVTAADSAHPGGSPVIGVQVEQWNPDDLAWTPIAVSGDGATTDGHHVLRNLPSGTYTLDLQPRPSSPGLEQWLGGGATEPGTPTDQNSFTVTDGSIAQLGTVTLADAPVATGSVVDDQSPPQAVAGAHVRSYVYQPDVCGTGCGDWSWFGVTTVDDTGHFSVKVPSAAGVQVTFRAAKPGYYRQWFGGTPTMPTAPDAGNSVTTTGQDQSVSPALVLPRIPTTYGALTGTITRDSDGSPVAQADVWACNQDDTDCQSASTGSDGVYHFAQLLTGPWTLEVYPSGGSLVPAHATTQIAQGTITTTDVVMHAPTPPPGGAALTQGGEPRTEDGMPAVYFGDPTDLRVPGPAPTSFSDTHSYHVTFGDGSAPVSGPLTYDSTTQTWHAVIPAFYPAHGPAHITTDVIPTGSSQPTAFDIYIDPSGTVIDQFGNPVVGAAATLLSAASASGPWNAVANGSTVMSPSNRTNPMTTGSSGQFGWDVAPGWYEVTGHHAGCQDGTTQPLQVPPAQLDLEVTLTCAMPAPTTPASVTGTPTPGGSLTAHPASGGSWSGDFTGAPTYQWLRDNGDIVGATGPSYVVGAGDQGHAISVRESVTHSPRPGSSAAYQSMTTTAVGLAVPAPAAPSKANSSTSVVVKMVKVKRKKKRAAIVTMSSSTPVSGTVSISVDGRVVAVVPAGSGVTAYLPKQRKKGRHVVVASYTGSPSINPSSGTTTFSGK